MQTNPEFEFFITADQSPTLSLKGSNPLGEFPEKMHHSGGAFSETFYIYGEAMELAMSEGLSLDVLVVGLGLGYIEILAQALALKYQKPLHILSFEAVLFLKNTFIDWLLQDSFALETLAETNNSLKPSSSNYHNAYNLILQMTADKTGQDALKIHQSLKENFLQKNFVIENALDKETIFSKKYSVIQFDAYCSKTSPELWHADLIEKILREATSLKAVFSTYAAKGILNKLLKQNNFQLLDKKGFAGKRESTLAIRK